MPKLSVASIDGWRSKDRIRRSLPLFAKLLTLCSVGLSCYVILSRDVRGLLAEQIGTKKAASPSNAAKGSCAAINVPVKDEWGARRLEFLFPRKEIPGISQQHTKRGHNLRTLWAFDGRVHLGFGDYYANTGPIPMHAWDPKVQSWVYLGTIPTEQVEFFRPGPGVLYMPEIDSRGEDRKRASAVYKLTCASDEWTLMGNPINGSAHNYDLALHGSKILVATGSRTDEPALLVASDDQAETWTEILRREPLHQKHCRFNYVASTNNLIFVSGRQRPHTSKYFAWIHRKGEKSFEPITNLEISKPRNSSRPPYLVPVTLRDEMIIAAFTDPPTEAGKLLDSYRISGNKFVRYDPWPTIGGQRANLVFWAPDLDRLLVLMERKDGIAGVFRTDSLGNNTVWEKALLLPPLKGNDHFTSMTLLLNDLYLGTRRGNLYVVREFYKPVTSNVKVRF